MISMQEQLSKLGEVIDQNTEVRGVKWLSEAHESLDDSTEILILHRTTDDGEDEYTVREYPTRENTPHKQARLSERKWNGAAPEDAFSQRARRVFPSLKLDMEKIGLDEHDVVWVSKRIGRLLEKRVQKQLSGLIEEIKVDG